MQYSANTFHTLIDIVASIQPIAKEVQLGAHLASGYTKLSKAIANEHETCRILKDLEVSNSANATINSIGYQLNRLSGVIDASRKQRKSTYHDVVMNKVYAALRDELVQASVQIATVLDERITDEHSLTKCYSAVYEHSNTPSSLQMTKDQINSLAYNVKKLKGIDLSQDTLAEPRTR